MILFSLLSFVMINFIRGEDGNIPAAQEVLLARAKANSLANLGQYQGGAGGEGANASTFVKGYVY